MGDFLEVLKQEFNAEEGSFLLKLRIDLTWDDAAFVRLTNAMQEWCERHATSELRDRWLAEGFWYASWFIRDWTSNEAFPRVHAQAFYDEAYQRVFDLAVWFFAGESPFQSTNSAI